MGLWRSSTLAFRNVSFTVKRFMAALAHLAIWRQRSRRKASKVHRSTCGLLVSCLWHYSLDINLMFVISWKWVLLIMVSWSLMWCECDADAEGVLSIEWRECWGFIEWWLCWVCIELKHMFCCNISDGLMLGCCWLACSAHAIMDAWVMEMLLMLRSVSFMSRGSAGYSCLEAWSVFFHTVEWNKWFVHPSLIFSFVIIVWTNFLF